MSTTVQQRSCQWGYCDRTTFASRVELLRHIKKHCAEARPVVRAIYESQDSNESASFRAPRLDFTGVHESNATNSNASGLSFIQGSSPPELYGSQSRNLQEDELPPPVLSAPPASIHSVVDRMAEEAQSQAALGERRLEEALQEAEQAEQLASAQTEDNANASIPSNLPNSPRRPQVAVLQAYPEGGDSLFQFGFSQVPALLQTNSLNVVGTSEQEASNTNVQFALNFSQVVDSQAMTQI